MKNTFKKFTAGASLIAMLSAGAVFAEEATLISEEVPATVITEEAVVANAPAAPFVTTYENIDGVTMLPVRAVAEHFGFNVEWIDEAQAVTLTKGAVYVAFAINENSYAFSRMAPQQLESAPVLFNNETTYVPASLFTDLLNLNIREVEGGIEVVQPRTVEIVSVDAENGSISVIDEFQGEVIVNITDETSVSVNGEVVSGFEFESGMLIDIEYADFMTMSIPPQTNAVAIEVLNQPVEVVEVPTVKAEGVEVLSVEEGAVTISHELHGEVVLNIAPTTVITSGESIADFSAIEVGQTLNVEHSEAMTMSIPPQTAAVAIEIVK